MTTFTADTKNANSVCSKSPYRPEIDGLRALAIVTVIINHFNKDILPSGYLGVDIFFVISGFVITSSLASRPSKKLGDFLMGFYTRRIKHLVPALVLFVAVTSILICLFNRVWVRFPAALRRNIQIAIQALGLGAKRLPYPVCLQRGS